MGLNPSLLSITFLVINNADGRDSKVFTNCSFSITLIYGNANILLMARVETERERQREDDGQRAGIVTDPSASFLGLISGVLPG